MNRHKRMMVANLMALTILGVFTKSLGPSLYNPRFASGPFITATTVGYGDLRSVKRRSRVIAIMIALVVSLSTYLFTLTVVANGRSVTLSQLCFPWGHSANV
jgi:Ion channel